MEFLTALPSIGVLSAIVISFFCLFNGVLFLWIYRNWQRSNKTEPELSEKEKQYQEFTDITGYYFIPRERFIYLHTEVIRACFNIWMKGVVTKEDFYHFIDHFPHVYEVKYNYFMVSNARSCLIEFNYHNRHKMIFPADKFFQVFFGFGHYYEQVLNDNKK